MRSRMTVPTCLQVPQDRFWRASCRRGEAEAFGNGGNALPSQVPRRVCFAQLFTLGIPSSPWPVFYRTDTEDTTEKNKDGTIRSVHSGGFSQGMKIELISWSSLFGVGGYGLIEASRRLRPK